MLQRWKLILTNWINCYFNKSEDEKKNLSTESLVTIISHLRENLSLDESKSSLLEANTVEEFLCEKYPEFKFENGTVEASNEEEICLSASVLLFFVCVNSKNFDIKNAMCSKLSVDNQETILKYSKCLMECPVITVGDVQAAITEACGQDIAALDLPIQNRVAETPPAMRSMHNNIRRLQAELEAERFDRNYLQEELSRTNNRLEQLLKEKEQYKLKILNLKAKISLCCGEDGVSKNTEMSAEVSDKLSRELHQLQLTLEEAQAQLHDVEYERDQYKAKMDELKNDRDKLLELNQREYVRVSQLSDELETERRHSQSLKDLVAELRQHNRLNGLDASSLECDDPDSSIHSLPHNSSICSEACANVVEVQLGEERAKIVVLQQQIQMLQAQINELNQIRETEKSSLEQEAAQRENDICNLKHRINEEIEKKNNLKAHCDNENTKLNNEINELEQKLKDNHEYSRNIIERKMEEIQTLQEEKISLLHSLSNETTKLENIIKELNHELDSEKQSRSRMKESYENHFMKLNEKVLNRNNELVELQNSIFIKAEEIETLQVEIRNEKDEFSKLMSQYNSLSEGKNILLTELRNERETCQKLLNDNQILNEQKNSLHIEVRKERLVSEEFMNKFQKISQEKDAIEKELAREQKLLKDLNNKYHDIEEQCDILQNDLKKVKEAGKKLQNKYHTLHEHHKTLKFEQEHLIEVYNLLQNKYQELEKQENAMRTELNNKNDIYEDLKQKYDNTVKLNISIENELKIKQGIIDELQNKYLSLEDNSKIIHIELDELKNKFEKQTIQNQDIIEQNNYVQIKLEKEKEAMKELAQNYRIVMEQKIMIENDLKYKCEEEQNLKLDLETKVHSLKDKLAESENLADKLKTSYESQIENLNVMVTTLSNYFKERTAEIDTLKADKNILQQSVDDTHKVLKLLKDELNTNTQIIERMTLEIESERQVLKNMVTVTESVMEDTKVCLNNEISELSKVKYSLEADKNHLQACLINIEEKYEATETAYTSVLSLLRLEKKWKQEVEKESEMICENLDEVIRVLCDERKINAGVILTLETQKQAFTEENEKLKKELHEVESVNNELKATHEALDEELKSRKEGLQKILEEKTQLEERLQELIENFSVVHLEAKELNGKIDDMTNENNYLKQRELESSGKVEEMNAAIISLESELLTQGEKFKKKLEENSQAVFEVHALSEKLANALKEKSEIECEMQEKIQNLTVAQLEIKELQSNILILTDENNNLKMEGNESYIKIKDLESALTALGCELQSDLETPKQKLETILADKIEIENALQDKADRLIAVQLENEELQSKVTALTDENNNLILEKQCHLIKLEECNIKEIDLKNDLEVVSYLNKNLTVAMKAVENELITQHEQLTKVEEEKQDLVNSLDEKLQHLNKVQQDLKNLEIQIVDHVDLINNLKCEKEEFITKIKEFEATIEDLKQVKIDNLTLKSALIKLEKLFQIKDEELQTILNEKHQLKNHVAEELQEKSQVAKSLQETMQNLIEVQLENSGLRDRVSCLMNEKNILELKNQECLAKIVDLKAKIIDLEEVKNYNQELRSTMTVLENELQTKVEKLQTTLQEKDTIESDLRIKSDLVTKVLDEKSQVEQILEEKSSQEKSHSAMITKLTTYLKDKTTELESLRKDREILQQTVGDNCKVIKTLEEKLKTHKETIDKLMSDFESEKQVLKNVVSATESVMEDTKLGLNNEVSQHLRAKDRLEVEIKELKIALQVVESKYQGLDIANTSLFSLLKLERQVKQNVEKESEIMRDYLDEVVSYISKERNTNTSVISALEFQEKAMTGDYERIKNELEVTQNTNHELKLGMKAMENELQSKHDTLQRVLEAKAFLENELQINADQLAKVLQAKSHMEKVVDEKTKNLNVFQLEILELKRKIAILFDEKNNLEMENKDSFAKVEEFKAVIDSSETKEKEELTKLKTENIQLLASIDGNRIVISNLEHLIKHELEKNHKLCDDYEQEKLVMSNRCLQLQDYQANAEKVLKERQTEIETLQNEVQTLQSKVDLTEQDSKAKDGLISKMSKEKDAVISKLSKELLEERAVKEKFEIELQKQQSIINELRNSIEIRALKKENEQLIRAFGQQETFTVLCQEKAAEKYACLQEPRESHQVDNTSDYTHSSVESQKTITDLENIIHDKNRTITTLQTDITYLKTIIAESEIKLLDITKELEMSKDNAQQLSNQLKKIVYQKNEEIADLKKQVTKMSATENRATEIIKVSSKYQAMILKRIAEIKSNTVLKELTNLGNSDNELRRSLNAGSVTMEELENFLETTDRHLKRCAEKQIVLQKERDRLTEVNRINESEIINLKKFLTELSVSFQTFNSVKELYANKLIRVISIQRTVRRDILALDGRISDTTMCKLERGYGAVMQDLAECTMNLERWVERCISRTVSVEKIKKAFTSDTECSSLSSPSFQNTGMEIQLGELEKSFQKVIEEIARAVKIEGSTESQAATVMEVRAEYEDKLNRMKAKMKDLFNEQMSLLKNKQKEEILLLERELQKTRSRMEDSKRAYESHIKELTKELWNVGEKYLVKNDEAEWLRKKQRSGSLMSLQHVHSSGLVQPQELPSRPSDAHSLRSLPISEYHPKPKREGRGLHMSDEEGEVFDNRCLKELAMTPRRDTGQRLSELKWRNSLCPPHLKSSYPAETQFAPTINEDDLKAGGAEAVGARAQRKEVGITAYKKPGPPTPSKQAGRLSATDSELRESLRVDNDPHAQERKTSTPARFRAFLRLNKNDHSDGTPRRRLSNIFRKK